MFFDPKMQLVWVDGPLDRLDEFIERCCVNGKQVHPARALEHMSASAGFSALTEENPWGPMVEQVEQAAEGFDIPIVQPTLADGRAPGAREYLARLRQTLDAHRGDKAMLQKQLEICRQGAEAFEHFSNLSIDVEKTQHCDYIKIRFGKLPRRGYALLARDHGADPYVLFVPCSEDETSLWGVYFAPKEDAARVDGIFAEAFFERLRLPGAAGTPAQIVKNLQHNIELLQKEIAQANAQMERLWNEEKWRIAGIYASVCSLARLFELRRCAAVRGEHFFYCVWVCQPELPAFTAACAAVEGLCLSPDQVMPLHKWKQQTDGR